MASVSNGYYLKVLNACSKLLGNDKCLTPIYPKTVTPPIDQDARIPMAYFFEFMSHCARQWQGEPFPIALANVFSHIDGIDGDISQANLCAPTWRKAIQTEQKYQFFDQDFAVISIQENLNGQKIIWQTAFANPNNGAIAMEYLLTSYFKYSQWVSWSGDIPVKSIYFRHQPDETDQDLSKALGCPVYYGQTQDAIFLERNVLDKTTPQADNKMFAVLEARLEARRREFTDKHPTKRAVSKTIRRLIAFSVPDLVMVADKLGVSDRQLRAKLKEEGVSYRQVLQLVRREMCEEMMQAGNTDFYKIAEALGYSERSAFQRAFKTWYGYSPKVYARAVSIFNSGFEQLAAKTIPENSD